jgi:hypothetical protein
VWPQGPWSPVGYQVVEVAGDEVPTAEPSSPPPRRPQKKAPFRRPAPWAQPGYRVEEFTDVEPVEEPGPDATRRPSPEAACARKARPTLLSCAFIGGGSFLLFVAVGLVLVWAPIWARPAPAVAAPARVVNPPAAAPRADDVPPVAREAFGTTVGFVRNPAEAMRAAARERKLALVLHVSGSFDDPGFT